jgi:V8-like Glu-specific endopeptidase
LTNYFAKPNLTISGYEENQLFTHTNSISDIKKGTISYKIDTAGGQGGSPVCIANKDNKVVAIHKGYLHD